MPSSPKTVSPALDFLKIDVEGGESRLLRGAANSIRAHRPVLLVEVAHEALLRQQSSREELLNVIQSFGYIFYVFDSATGLPKLAPANETADNMIAAPRERPLPLAWCAPAATAANHHPVTLTRLSGSSAPFDLSQNVVFNNSKLSGRSPLSVSTPPQQWAFAVGFRVNPSALAGLAASREIRVSLELTVKSGEIGIGVVNGKLSAYLTTEQRYPAAANVQCEIAFQYLPPDSILVLRNTAANGKPSKAILRSIATFAVS